MSIREMAARVLFSDPVDNYLGTVLTALDLICSDINCLYSTDTTYTGLIENLCDTYCDPTFYNPKKYVIDPELKRVSKPDAYSPYIRDRANMLAAYINNTRATSAEIVRSMVLLAQLVKIPDRDKLILDALHALITEVEIDKVRSYAQTMYTTFLSVHEQERGTLLKVLNTMGTIDLSTINNLL